MGFRGACWRSPASVAAVDGTEPGVPGPPFAVLLVQSEPGGPAVVQVEGDLDALTAPRLAALLACCDSQDVVVDVRAVPVLSAAGLGVLAVGAGRLAAGGGRLRVDVARPLAARCFWITGLQGLLTEAAPATQPPL